MRKRDQLAMRLLSAAREVTMGKGRFIWTVGLAACAALPALAASLPVDDKNGKITNVLGESGAGSDNNGNGNAKFDGATGTWEVNGGGQGIWNTADGMTFVSTDLQGDGNITARILDEKGGSGDGWMRSGVMIRETDSGDAAYTGVFPANEDSATPRGRHIHAHFRYHTGDGMSWGGDTGAWGPEGDRTPTDGGIGLRYFPLYLRAQRHGNMVMTFRSDDGKLLEQTTKEQELDLP